MAIRNFSAFISTVTRFLTRPMQPSDVWLTDPTTGAITGVRSPIANGPDARFVPVDITLAQAMSPSRLMLADLDATYRLNVAPYTRYVSDGVQLVPLGDSSENVVLIPAGFNYIFKAPLTISAGQELIVEGGAYVE